LQCEFHVGASQLGFQVPVLFFANGNFEPKQQSVIVRFVTTKKIPLPPKSFHRVY
jgi:hypothetical protein